MKSLISLVSLMSLALPLAAESCPMSNTFTKLLRDKKLSIAIVGNSVTHGAKFDKQNIDSFYLDLLDWFKTTFPDAEITAQTGIIFAIGPEVQVFRMEDKTFATNPDLVVVEFGAANGAWGERGRSVTDPATEGFIRRIRQHQPEADIFMNLGLFTTMMDDYRAARTPGTVTFLKSLGKHYGFPIANSGSEMARRILAGDPWDKFMTDGIHPTQVGYRLHGEVIRSVLDKQYALYKEEDKRHGDAVILSINPKGLAGGSIIVPPLPIKNHPIPTTTLTPNPWVNPRLFTGWEATDLGGFQRGESGRVRFIEGDANAASGKFIAPEGRIVGLFFYNGHSPSEPRANIDVRFDGAGDWHTFALEREPCFTEEDDPANYLRRLFFGGYGFPGEGFREIDFRATPNDEARTLRICGFFVVK